MRKNPAAARTIQRIIAQVPRIRDSVPMNIRHKKAITNTALPIQKLVPCLFTFLSGTC